MSAMVIRWVEGTGKVAMLTFLYIDLVGMAAKGGGGCGGCGRWRRAAGGCGGGRGWRAAAVSLLLFQSWMYSYEYWYRSE